MQRDTFISTPAPGDYILNPAGFTWHIRGATATGSMLSLSVTDRTRKAAVARMLSLAETDRVDAWEKIESGWFRLVKRFRA
jgi:hypothetical protein